MGALSCGAVALVQDALAVEQGTVVQDAVEPGAVMQDEVETLLSDAGCGGTGPSGAGCGGNGSLWCRMMWNGA